MGALTAGLLPGPALGALLLAVGLAWGGAMAALAARFRAGGTRIPYTRKIFHFGIFSGAALVHARWGLPGTNVYGAAVAGLVLWAVWRGDASGLYRSLARDTDRPRRTLFIVVPLVTTAVGGLLSALVAGPYAAVGYLVAGWGDAVGEPAGARWGRHAYRVPSLGGVPATRSWEGSAAVFAASWVAGGLALALLGMAPGLAVGLGAGVAAAAAVVEALSPHGTDNLTVQLAASVLAFWLARAVGF
jgi:phytol kinase